VYGPDCEAPVREPSLRGWHARVFTGGVSCGLFLAVMRRGMARRNEDIMAHPVSPEPSQGSVTRPPTPAERGQLLAGWNDTARDVPQVTLAELFEAQVTRTPDTAAVVCVT
jgi:hypothetical protein